LPNTFAPNLPDLKTATLKTRIRTERCRETGYISISYPTNFGDEKFDEHLANFFKETYFDRFVGGTIVEMMNASCENDNFEVESDDPEAVWDNLFHQHIIIATFDVYSVRPGIVSLIVTINTGGWNHPNQEYQALNFDVAKRELLTLEDIFENPRQSLEIIWPYIAHLSCLRSLSRNYGDASLPRFYDSNSACPSDGLPGIPLPENLKGERVGFEDLADAAYFTDQGLILEFASYNAWGSVYGPLSLTIPPTILQEAGVRPDFWPK
jgi:hypothetical protein